VPRGTLAPAPQTTLTMPGQEVLLPPPSLPSETDAARYPGAEQDRCPIMGDRGRKDNSLRVELV
jgi:hypothetical protein